MSMWEPFTEPARRVMVIATEVAQEFGQNYIDGDHIFVSITRAGESGATQALDALGITKARVDEAAKSVLPQAGLASQEMTFTRAAKQVIEGAFEEARKLQHRYIGCEHLLLAYASVCGTGTLAQKLELDPAALREKTLEIIAAAPAVEPVNAPRAAQPSEPALLPALLQYIERMDQPGKLSAVESSSERRLYYIDTEDIWNRLISAAGRRDLTGSLLYAMLIAKREGISPEELIRDVFRRLHENYR